MSARTHNFSAGPCTLPLSVLTQAQAELLDFQDSGMSVMEISHRSRLFEPLHEETLALAQTIIGAPDEFQCLLLPGGASLQFAMSALNLLSNCTKATAIHSGIWAEKAINEANRVATMDCAWSGAQSQFTMLPDDTDITFDPHARYLHVTSNETINGIQFHRLPNVPLPLVVDMSSDYYTREVPWSQCDVVYGGVQKNLAPSGLALVFIRKSCLCNLPHLPLFLSYQTHAIHNSLYNTPPTWQIYLLNSVLKWIKSQGGIAYFSQQAAEKSAKLYAAIDASDFYQNTIVPDYRSMTNVVFRTPSDALDTAFWQAAEKAGLFGLKGHKLVGGIRASLYNALDMTSVDALIAFMHSFALNHQDAI